MARIGDIITSNGIKYRAEHAHYFDPCNHCDLDALEEHCDRIPCTASSNTGDHDVIYKRLDTRFFIYVSEPESKRIDWNRLAKCVDGRTVELIGDKGEPRDPSLESPMEAGYGHWLEITEEAYSKHHARLTWEPKWLSDETCTWLGCWETPDTLVGYLENGFVARPVTAPYEKHVASGPLHPVPATEAEAMTRAWRIMEKQRAGIRALRNTITEARDTLSRDHS